MTGCTSSEEGPPQEIKVPVRVASPIFRDITEYIDATGVLQGSKTCFIRSQVDGHLLKTFVKEGQWVEKGQRLFLIDPKPYLLKVKEAKAERAKAEVAYEVAKKKLDRFESLAHKELIAKNEWDELEGEVKSALAEKKLSTAKLKSALLDLQHCILRAGTHGRIGKIAVDEGQLISSIQEMSLVQIVELDPLFCEFHLTEKELMRLSSNQMCVEVDLLSKPGSAKKGEIFFIDNQFDANSGQIALLAKIENADTSLRPGQLVRVRIPVDTRHRACLIPIKALGFTQTGARVFIVEKDNSCKEHAVLVGDEKDGLVTILSGLSLDAQVVVEGAQFLYPGAKVEVKP
jgi:RND family efflux transporter MFP subunit